MSTAETYVDIYTNLGFLFYSVAAGDGQVRKAEVDTLKQLVKDKWMPLESSRDEFGVDSAEYINMSFDHAHDNAMKADDAYARFTAAYHEHKENIDSPLRELILDTAAAIADAYGQANKAELSRLAQLQQLFRE